MILLIMLIVGLSASGIFGIGLYIGYNIKVKYIDKVGGYADLVSAQDRRPKICSCEGGKV